MRNLATLYGGGASDATLNNCTLMGNWAGMWGGGALNSSLNNCVLAGNSAYQGGGAWSAMLNNCTLTGNSAYDSGGGAYDSTLNNCIAYYNTAKDGPNYVTITWSSITYSCTTPPRAGAGNLTNAPLFVDTNGWSNLRLQSNSPCINAGDNDYAPVPADIEGDPRIAGGRVDIGAYEFQGGGLSGFTAWLWQYGQPIDGSADFTDPDADRANNWQEWRCDTDPTNALSVLRLLTPLTDGANLLVTWESVAGRVYSLERSGSLTPGSFQPLATNVAGQSGLTTFVDTNAASAGSHYYRVGVP